MSRPRPLPQLQASTTRDWARTNHQLRQRQDYHAESRDSSRPGWSSRDSYRIRRVKATAQSMLGMRTTPCGHVQLASCEEPSARFRFRTGSSPSTPATARAASSSSCGACPASAITAPSSAPENASATALAGGPGGIDPSLRPALIRRAQRLTSRFRDPLDLAPDRMVLTAELDPQRHHDAGDVSPAKDGVTARQRDQRSDRIGLLARPAHPPRASTSRRPTRPPPGPDPPCP